jgi:hypothetical protein
MSFFCCADQSSQIQQLSFSHVHGKATLD